MAKPNLEHIVDPLRPLAVEIDTVKPNPHNPRTEHDLAGIQASFKMFGQRTPLVVNSVDGLIEAGEGRWRAAKALGWQWIAVVFATDDPETAMGYTITDGRLSDISHFNFKTVAAILRSLPEKDRLDIPGFNLDSIGWILDSNDPTLDPLDDLDPIGDEGEEGEILDIRFQINPQALDLFNSLMDQAQGRTDSQRFACLLAAVDPTALAHIVENVENYDTI